MSIQEDQARWEAAAHAMQSGVQMEMNWDSEPTSPKHLRVGINVALRDHGSLVGLLIEKGVFTDEEYAKAIADGMEEEKQNYEKRINEHYGSTGITLG